MKDNFGRKIDYMRISITDRCNLRCCYCMPDGVECVPMREILTLEEYARIAACGALLGIKKIKVTGGEPFVRLGCCSFIRMLKETPGIEKVTVTTNGILLDRNLEELADAGIDGINISLDTPDPDLYGALTGGGDVKSVLNALEHALKLCGSRHIPVKINAVSLDLKDAARQLGVNYNGKGWQDMLAFARDYPVDVRFIEMMPVGYGKRYQSLNHEILLKELKIVFPNLEKDDRIHGNGPAVYYRIPGFQGGIGLISAIHGKFCPSCNRLRLTSQGYLKSCLCFEDGEDLKTILRGSGAKEEQDSRIVAAMERAITGKPAAHCFEHPEQMTEYDNMVSIGG